MKTKNMILDPSNIVDTDEKENKQTKYLLILPIVKSLLFY